MAILPLIDQFVVALEAARARVTLERRGDWLVMATTLLQLKAQLLWPLTPEAAADAAADATRHLAALDTMAGMRAAAAWLTSRPRVGIDVSPRGHRGPTSSARAELTLAFLAPTLVILEGHEGQGGEEPPTYRPVVRDLWRVADALERIQRLLGEAGTAQPFAAFLPGIDANATRRELRCRAAVASTFVAGLELARNGMLSAEQGGELTPIWFTRADG